VISSPFASALAWPFTSFAPLRCVPFDEKSVTVADPLSAFRAMAKTALAVYGELRTQGTQKGVLEHMQTRSELYEVIGYHAYEQKLDELFHP